MVVTVAVMHHAHMMVMCMVMVMPMVMPMPVVMSMVIVVLHTVEEFIRIVVRTVM